MNKLHTFTFNFVNMHFNIILIPHLNYIIPQSFPTKSVHALLIFVPRPSHHLDLIAITKVCEQHKALSSSGHRFLHQDVHSSPFIIPMWDQTVNASATQLVSRRRLLQFTILLNPSSLVLRSTRIFLFSNDYVSDETQFLKTTKNSHTSTVTKR